MTVIIGVDPGARGGLAVIAKDHALSVIVLPDVGEFATEVCRWHKPHVFIERAQSFPGQGISSAFNYGAHFGTLLGVLVALEIRHTLVPARVWHKVMTAGCSGGEPKARSLEAVRRLYPGVDLRASPKCRVPHDGLVDALLIAGYGERVLTGKGSA